MKTSRTMLVAFVVAFGLAALSGKAANASDTVESPKAEAKPEAQTKPAKAPKHAIAVLASASGSTVTGWVKFAVKGNRVKIEAKIEGLTPGLHGFHIHEVGDCSAPDATSAGGHFNPAGAPHAGHGAPQRHAGDLGNIEANAKGVAKLKLNDSTLTFEGAMGILGRSVIVHADPDDFTTQPTGKAGKRVACGVISVDAGKAGK